MNSFGSVVRSKRVLHVVALGCVLSLTVHACRANEVTTKMAPGVADAPPSSQSQPLARAPLGAPALVDTRRATVFRGLATLTVLPATRRGRAALDANYRITSEIQNQTSHFPQLQSRHDQDSQALQDATVTFIDAAGLADGLGTRLTAAYRAKPSSLPPALLTLLHSASSMSGADSAMAKFFFANGSLSSASSAPPVPTVLTAIVTGNGGIFDVFGKAYHLPAGSPHATQVGNARPFETEHSFRIFTGRDYFNAEISNFAYLRGPAQNAVDSPAYPSGHTTFAYTDALVLAMLVPERYPQLLTRAAEYGNSRIVLGAHYAMDVIAGRTLAYYDVAHLLASQNSAGAGFTRSPATSTVSSLVRIARSETRDALERRLAAMPATACGTVVATCARDDTSRLTSLARDAAFSRATLTYDLPTVYVDRSAAAEDVALRAPEAGYLLLTAFPKLTLREADDILTKTEGPGGGFLDNGSGFGVYSRLDLVAASLIARDRTSAPRS